MSEPKFDDDSEAREWCAQERALALQRGAARCVGDDDALVARYSDVARALDALPRPVLQEGFAVRVARRARIEGARDGGVLGRFEHFALAVLVASFVIATGWAVVSLGISTWIVDQARNGGVATTRWMLAMIVCVAVWAIGPRTRAR